MKLYKRRKKVGLALGGGGARGCAHIGVIRALQEADIPIDCIAGTSIGSFIGGAYALGHLDELERILLRTTWSDIVKNFDPTIPKEGLFAGNRIVRLMEKLMPSSNFREAKIPYRAIATDLKTGEEVHIKSGKITDAIRASVAIPGILKPAQIKGRYLIDGGVVNPLPVDVARKLKADIVIAVDLNHNFMAEKQKNKKKINHHRIPLKGRITNLIVPTYPTIINVIENSVFMMQSQLTQKNLLIHKPDFLIQPDLKGAGIFDFHMAESLIEEGYRKTKKILKKIKKKLNE